MVSLLLSKSAASTSKTSSQELAQREGRKPQCNLTTLLGFSSLKVRGSFMSSIDSKTANLKIASHKYLFVHFRLSRVLSSKTCKEKKIEKKNHFDSCRKILVFDKGISSRDKPTKVTTVSPSHKTS
eukprot:TRINITY_DN11078_c0_g1_i2.p1 TRINITY_DN11078_c0_g1~~TRINITY_DN11078_c0_g1_i2.p1  ORF type:complete len:126 (+),score=7.91 TRINITY_DN11078_c0_g1_i2:79-456(+)